MRALVLADLHANRPALDAVLEAAAGEWEAALLLGDVVGYGPHPNEVCERVRGLPALRAVRGNHDRAAAAGAAGAAFNDVARESMAWTVRTLADDHRAWLGSLPAGPLELEGPRRVVLSHGTPFDEDDYLFGAEVALAVAAAWPGRIVLYGHTHLPQCVAVQGGRIEGPAAGPDGRFALSEGPTWLLNPGSVGQPRDGIAHAAHGILDTRQGTFELRRAAYDVDAVRRDILAAGLPRPLADRLSDGS